MTTSPSLLSVLQVIEVDAAGAPATPSLISTEPAPPRRFPREIAGDRDLCGGGTARAVSVPLADFMPLTEISIIIYYGDSIPETPVVEPGPDQWRALMGMARLWLDAVNRRGGDVTLVHLPEQDVRGNTHFPMSDLNSVQIADLLSRHLADKKLD